MKKSVLSNIKGDSRFHIENILLSIVVPVYNESESINNFYTKILEIFKTSKLVKVELVFIDDGSTDSSLETLLNLKKESNISITVLELTRNFGKEAALTAGIESATGDAVVPMDIDLQDPPELIPLMIELWREGYDVVLARRVNRATDSFLKRKFAGYFYFVNNLISTIDIPDNVGDFRLIDRGVVNALSQLHESRRFMKGLFAWVGFRTTTIEYVRPARVSGYSKFSGWKLWNFAIEGITSFGEAPLKIWTYIGGFVALVSIFYALFIIFKVLLYGVDIPGYASLAVAVMLLGGLQMVGIGILGEYLGRTYIESKRRPVYLIRKLYR